MKQSLCSLAQVIRSKNAGPYELVLDILFKTREDYQRVKRSEQLTPQLIAGLYNVKPDFIHRIIWFDPANAVKIVMPRDIISGNVGDNDVYGAQQHAPLLSIEFDLISKYNNIHWGTEFRCITVFQTIYAVGHHRRTSALLPGAGVRRPTPLHD
jgi:hypothetical protein